VARAGIYDFGVSKADPPFTRDPRAVDALLNEYRLLREDIAALREDIADLRTCLTQAQDRRQAAA